jgi:hypothetical protein
MNSRNIDGMFRLERQAVDRKAGVQVERRGRDEPGSDELRNEVREIETHGYLTRSGSLLTSCTGMESVGGDGSNTSDVPMATGSDGDEQSNTSQQTLDLATLMTSPELDRCRWVAAFLRPLTSYIAGNLPLAV